MRRYTAPFNGMQYVLNNNTHEIHDLDRENVNCRIDNINAQHVYNCDNYIAAEIQSVFETSYAANGCAYCMPEKDRG